MTPFSTADRRAWCKLGDVLLPGHGPLPCFSASGAVERIPRLLAASHPEDAAALRTVARALAVLPAPLITLVLRAVLLAARLRGPVGGPFRLLELGLRGILLSSYFAGLDRGEDGVSAVYAAIGYRIHCEPDTDTAHQ